MAAAESLPSPLPAHHALRAFRWDLVVIGMVVLAAGGFVALLDTGALVRWTAANKDAKVDEFLVVAFVLACVSAVVYLRRWLGLTNRLLHLEAAPPTEVWQGHEVQSAFRHDLIGVSLAIVFMAVAVPFVDTGSLAEWVARQADTRIDEAIVSVFTLMIGLSFFSIRRWRELSQQLVLSEQLRRTTAALNREATILGELSDLLQSCRSADEAYRLITDHAQILFAQSSGAVCTIGASRDVVDVAASWDDPALTDRFFAASDCWALRRGRPNILGTETTGARCAHIGPGRPTRAMCVPMMAQGEALGLLYLDAGRDSTGGPARLWSEGELRLAKTLSEQAALALANLALRETLRLQSVHDALTNLYNRRYLEESLARELLRSARKGTPVGLMMIDVDHFKRLNDTFGHDAGDAVLRALGRLFTTLVRGEDVVCRYGGEEFTMLLPDASLEATRVRAEAIREAVTHMVVESRGQALAGVTLSIGVANAPEHGTTSEHLLRAADAALYRAKESGRDRVVTA